MKKILLTLLMITSSVLLSSSWANVCVSVMRYSNGAPFMNFSRYNSFSMQQACRDANFDCNYDLKYRQSGGDMLGGYCDIGSGHGRNTICTFDMLTRRNRLISRFVERGRDNWQACRKAESRCLQELRYRQSRGQNPYARCVRSYGNSGDIVTRFCRIDRVDIYNRIIHIYNRSATGPRQSGVKRKACQKAMYECRSHIFGDQRCLYSGT